MDFTSIEFYTIAFCVAIGVLCFFLGQKRTKPASSYIHSLDLKKDDEAESTPDNSSGLLKLTADDEGLVTIERTGLQLVEGETVNLIATVIDDKLTIEEKKGKASALGGKEESFSGSVTVDYFLPNNKLYVRYDSSVSGQWCKFAFTNFPGNTAEHVMRY